MSSAHLLPGEQRRTPYLPSVEEAAPATNNKTGRSVRSIRQRFESEASLNRHATSTTTSTETIKMSSSSAPTTPAKKRPPTASRTTSAMNTNNISPTTTPISTPTSTYGIGDLKHSNTKPNQPLSSSLSKPRTQTKTQAELAAFLKAGKERMSNSSNSSNHQQQHHQLPPQQKLQQQQQQQQQSLHHHHHHHHVYHPATFDSADPSSALPNSSVGSLIEKWSTGAASLPRQTITHPSSHNNNAIDRHPLQERHVQVQPSQRSTHAQQQHHHHQPVVDSVDTFGSSSVDLDQFRIPKTDPGRLESFAAHARLLSQQQQPGRYAAATQYPTTGDQSLKEMVTRGMASNNHLVDHSQSQLQQQQQQDELNEEAISNIQTRIYQFMQVSHTEIQTSNPNSGTAPSANEDAAYHHQHQQHHQNNNTKSMEYTPDGSDITQSTGMGPSPIPPYNPHHNHNHNHQVFESPSQSDITPSPGDTPPSMQHPQRFHNNGPTDEYHHHEQYSIEKQKQEEKEAQAQSDWGAGDDYIRELFAEAEETAERAVQCDENEEYFEAFELYWVVVDLYSKVIPFLTPAEGVDVHERIKMYTRRCEAIREAFEDDGEEGGEQGDVPIDDVVTMNTENIEDDEGHSSNGVQQPFGDVRITGEETIPRNPAENMTNSHHHTQNQSLPPLPPNEGKDDGSNKSTMASAHDTYQNQQRLGNLEQGEPNATGELRRAPFPDYSERPLANIPEAPASRPHYITAGAGQSSSSPSPSGTTPNGQGTSSSTSGGNAPASVSSVTGLSASTQAHRNSLSRPISKSAARASTNSVSKEKVAEMQERVHLMQECLNNFTVKQKHLGPARALELAVTTLNANTFGDLKKLEPLAHQLEHRWATELGVLLSMLKEIKVCRPGTGYHLREDIAKHLPSLERCDRSVRKTMRSFAALAGHVRYVDRETATANSSNGGGGGNGAGVGKRKWWVKVPVIDRKGGLKEDVLKIVTEAEQEMRSVFKICREINVEIIKTIPVPMKFVTSLPKHARVMISKELKEGLTTWGMFKVSDYMKDRNMWNKEAAKEITSSLEKVALIWEQRTNNKSFLSRTFDIRGERFHQAVTAFRRCQNAIRDLRREWPTMAQTDLDMAKINDNKDIGLAGLESYSRALESRAYRLLTRIRELLDANLEARGEGKTKPSTSIVPPMTSSSNN